jgi:GTP cyclohydrolase II
MTAAAPPLTDRFQTVERAIADVRRGAIVALRGADGRVAATLAAELAGPGSVGRLTRLIGSGPLLAITGRRAAALTGRASQAAVRSLALPPAEMSSSEDWARRIADPTLAPASLDAALALVDEPPEGVAAAAVGLMRRARLLPAALLAAIDEPALGDVGLWAQANGLLVVDAEAVAQHPAEAARGLARTSEARVPLAVADATRVIAFRPRDGGQEHLAIVIDPPPGTGSAGAPAPVAGAPTLVRLHSQCFTGDLLGSLRCDCGEQLKDALAAIAAAGGGVLLYLAQEGRDIGLVNKLRAYQLQDQGFDTIDANEMIGFDADDRVYLPAAAMLEQLGIARVRLLTNNPAKVDGLRRAGVEVTERVPLVIEANRHNAAYLAAKKTRAGHLL